MNPATGTRRYKLAENGEKFDLSADGMMVEHLTPNLTIEGLNPASGVWGLVGREWAVSEEAGFTSKHQAYRFMDSMNELFSTWEPREKYELINVNEYPDRTLKHNLLY